MGRVQETICSCEHICRHTLSYLVTWCAVCNAPGTVESTFDGLMIFEGAWEGIGSSIFSAMKPMQVPILLSGLLLVPEGVSTQCKQAKSCGLLVFDIYVGYVCVFLRSFVLASGV